MLRVNRQSGFIKAIIIIVIALVILSLLGYRIEDIRNSSALKDNFDWLSREVGEVWSIYLKPNLIKIWDMLQASWEKLRA